MICQSIGGQLFFSSLLKAVGGPVGGRTYGDSPKSPLINGDFDWNIAHRVVCKIIFVRSSVAMELEGALLAFKCSHFQRQWFVFHHKYIGVEVGDHLLTLLRQLQVF